MHPDFVFLLAAVTAFGAGFVAFRLSGRSRFRLAAAGVALAAGALAVWFRPSQYVARAVAARFADPSVWLWSSTLVAGLICLKFRRRGVAAYLLSLFAVWGVLGNPWFAAWYARTRENPFAEVDPLAAGEFDAVVVLGGAVDTGPIGQPQLIAFSADRPILGARLYHAGRTARLVTTGAAVAAMSRGQRDPSELTAVLWGQLGIPADAIHRVGGHNTKEEAQRVADLAAQHDWQRIGLVTSPWHLDRAVKNFRAAGLDPTPLPAGFIGYYGHQGLAFLAPDPYDLSKVKILSREWIADTVGR